MLLYLICKVFINTMQDNFTENDVCICGGIKEVSMTNTTMSMLALRSLRYNSLSCMPIKLLLNEYYWIETEATNLFHATTDGNVEIMRGILVLTTMTRSTKAKLVISKRVTERNAACTFNWWSDFQTINIFQTLMEVHSKLLIKLWGNNFPDLSWPCLMVALQYDTYRWEIITALDDRYFQAASRIW